MLDQRCAGEVVMEQVVTSDADAKERYLVNGLMEEAIRSSQLEGATTSRQVTEEIRAIERLLEGDDGLNRRQLALLSDALRHPDRTSTYTAHAREHRVTHETARSDLSALADLGLLDRRQVGRRYLFTPSRELRARR